MGALADLQSQKLTFSTSSPIGQWVQSEINRKLDEVVPTAGQAANAVHTLAVSTMTSGNMTLTVTLRNGETFTTGNIAFNDSAATIEGLIDTAATAASVTGWTNGDISVSGGAVNVGAVLLTFDGTSVASIAHPITFLADVDGAGGAWGAITRTTAGQGARAAMGVLINYDIVSGTPFEQDAAASVDGMTKGSGQNAIPSNIVKALMREVAAEDANNSSYFTLEQVLMAQDRSPLVEERIEGDHVGE